METNTNNLATIALDGGTVVKRNFTYFLPMFDSLYGPTTVFVGEENKEKIAICRVYTDNNRFVTDESITLAELEKLRRESREYLEEIMEEEEALSDQVEEIFIGKSVEDFSGQMVEQKELDKMFG